VAVVKARSHEILDDTKWHKYIYYYKSGFFFLFLVLVMLVLFVTETREVFVQMGGAGAPSHIWPPFFRI
jgi:hypothetical protein